MEAKYISALLPSGRQSTASSSLMMPEAPSSISRDEPIEPGNLERCLNAFDKYKEKVRKEIRSQPRPGLLGEQQPQQEASQALSNPLCSRQSHGLRKQNKLAAGSLLLPSDTVYL